MWFNLKQLLMTSRVKSASQGDAEFLQFRLCSLLSTAAHTGWALSLCEYRALKDAPVNRKFGSFRSRSSQNGVGEKKEGCKEVRSSMCWFAHSRSDHCRSPTDHLYHGPLIDFGPDGRPGHICNWRSMWSSYIFIKRDPKIMLVDLSIA